jgi:serine/threonine protein phosphatase PrpC
LTKCGAGKFQELVYLQKKLCALHACAHRNSLEIQRTFLNEGGKFLFHTDGRATAANVARDPEKLLHRQQLHALVARDGGRLFEIDLLCGSGVFLKSGAAPSYIKRDSSIFRIRSQTTPIGLLKSIDTERISVEIKPGDHIIMMSDGIADITEDAPWLLLLLGEPPKQNLKEYADLILSEAIKNGAGGDDMSVTVIRVDEA